MTAPAKQKRITKTKVEALEPGQIIWDSDVPGFAARCLKRAPVYVLKYRIAGRQRWITIGTHGAPWTVETGRKEARRLLGDVAKGQDPAQRRDEGKAAVTVAQLCDAYLEAASSLVLPRRGRPKKPSTLATDRGRIERHIKPLLGRLKVDAVTPADVEQFQREIASGKTAADVKTGPHGRAIVEGGEGTASRTVGLLGGIFSYAVKQGLRPNNPVRGVVRYADRKLERFLSPTELGRLGDALVAGEREGENPIAIAAIRLALFTGARKSEILGLQWDWINPSFTFAQLPESKTGRKVIYLPAPAQELLASLPRLEKNPHVFPGERPGAHLIGLPRVWNRIRARANLLDVRLHDLRHSFASVGAAAGLGLPIIGALLGHTQAATTQRYAHLGADPLRAANDVIGARIAAAMSKSLGAEPGALPKRRS